MKILFRTILVLGCGALVLTAADRPAASKKSKKNAEPEAVEPKAMSVETLAEKARPSVVTVSHYGRDGKQNGVGAGFVVAANGLIATSLHVIGEARPITVQLADGRRFEVTEIHAWDRKQDLAVVRIAADHLPVLSLGNSEALKQGTPVVAIGNPLGLDHSVVQGVVSARRDIETLDMIQIAIPIEPGNSGGPLLDMQGRVHGILTLKSAVTANLGFAMPINALKPLLEKPNPVPMSRWLTIGALNPKEWLPVFAARWTQRAGRIQVDGAGAGFGGRSLCLSQSTVPDRPYEVSVTVRLDDEAGAAGLVFASDGDQKHYGFYPSAGQLRLTRFDGPDVYSWTVLKQVPSPHYRLGDWNTLRVRCEQEKILCYVNDQLVIESTDRGLTGGKVGLAKFRETKADFKSFQVGDKVVAANLAAPAELVASIARQVENLSDKPNPEIVAALQSQAEASRVVLLERAQKFEREAAQLKKLAGAVHRQAVQAELIKALAGPEDKIDLFHAALLIAKLDNAELEIEAYRRQLEGMGREIVARLPASADDAARLAALSKYLFAENGYHGSRGDFYNRANSYLNEVLDDREGLPITLSVLFLELAQRIGLQNVSGYPLPGHFMVKYLPKGGDSQLIDVYEGGKILTRDETEDLIQNTTSARLGVDPIKPSTKREIVIRMLNNLLGLVERTESATNALRYLDLIVALSPDSVGDRLKRAELRFRTGDPAGAKQDFKWLLDHEAPGLDLERIAEMYRSL